MAAALDTIWSPAAAPRAVLVLGHGAGSGMRSAFMSGIAEALPPLGVSVLRYDFPYITAGRRAPDRPPVLLDACTRAFAAGQERAEGLPVLTGGKSLGGRIASMAVADGMPAAGLVFLGYPLHPPGKPEQLRDAHLDQIAVPMLFIQGTNDAFARADLLAPVLARLGARAVLHAIEGGDHSFRAPGGPRDPAVIAASLAPVVADFARSL
jgi:predicted alpha/beta-hydrolase family hydrolase